MRPRRGRRATRSPRQPCSESPPRSSAPVRVGAPWRPTATLARRPGTTGPTGANGGASYGDRHHDDPRNHRCRTHRQSARAARGQKRLRRRPRELAWTRDARSARRRARTEGARRDRVRSGGGRRHRRRHHPAEELRASPRRAARGENRRRHEQLLPDARRPPPRARRGDDDDLRAPASAPADVEGRQSLQPHLRGGADDGRLSARHEEPPRARHRRQRRGGEGRRRADDRPIRLRHGRRRPAVGELANPARHPRLRTSPQRRGAPRRPRRREALPRHAVSRYPALPAMAATSAQRR